MAHFALLSPPDAGHLFPLGNLGVELVRRGHRATVVAHERGRSLADQLNLPFVPLDADDTPDVFTAFDEWTSAPFVSGETIAMREWFRWESHAVLRRAPTIFKDLAIDGVIMDQCLSAGGTVAEQMGLPYFTVCGAQPLNEDVGIPPSYTGWRYSKHWLSLLRNRLSLPGWRWYIGPTVKIINRYRKAWGLRRLSRFDDAFSPFAQFTQLISEFDYPRTSKPPQFHYVGSLSADRVQNNQEFPWERLDGRPLIYASLGTIADSLNSPVFPKIASACVGIDAQLVVARGKVNDEEDGRENTYKLEGDPLVVDFAPQVAMLERAAVMITHCGMNSTLEGISRGVPMVALPRNADQPANAARIEYSGAGLVGSFYGGTPEELREVIKRVLHDDSFRRRAKELQSAMRAAGGVCRAADITEEAMRTRRAVTSA